MGLDDIKYKRATHKTSTSTSQTRASTLQQTTTRLSRSGGHRVSSSDKAAVPHRGSGPSSSSRSAPSRQPSHAHTPKLDTRAILSDPRLPQVTGILPHKISTWDGKKPPPADELALLRWTMSLEETFYPQHAAGGRRMTKCHR